MLYSDLKVYIKTDRSRILLYENLVKKKDDCPF